MQNHINTTLDKNSYPGGVSFPRWRRYRAWYWVQRLVRDKTV